MSYVLGSASLNIGSKSNPVYVSPKASTSGKSVTMAKAAAQNSGSTKLPPSMTLPAAPYNQSTVIYVPPDNTLWYVAGAALVLWFIMRG